MNIKRKASIMYSWLVRSITFFLPDIGICMRFRGWLYGVMMKKKGRNFQVAHSAILNSISHLEVGDNVYIANNCSLLCGGGVILGDNVMLAPGVLVSSDNHTYDIDCGYRFGNVYFSEVKISKNSWICANSVVVAGTVIPEGVVVAPGSVCIKGKITNSYSIYSGVPAKFIKCIVELKE